MEARQTQAVPITRLGYRGTESSAAICYTQGVLQVLHERLIKDGRAITEDDLMDLTHCLEIALTNRRAEQEAEWTRR